MIALNPDTEISEMCVRLAESNARLRPSAVTDPERVSEAIPNPLFRPVDSDNDVTVIVTLDVETLVPVVLVELLLPALAALTLLVIPLAEVL